MISIFVSVLVMRLVSNYDTNLSISLTPERLMVKQFNFMSALKLVFVQIMAKTQLSAAYECLVETSNTPLHLLMVFCLQLL